MMVLENISAEDIPDVDIPTASPRWYTFDSRGEVASAVYL
jgi:bisphosphoglycerate-dependent phosphoglycerate mutase